MRTISKSRVSPVASASALSIKNFVSAIVCFSLGFSVLKGKHEVQVQNELCLTRAHGCGQSNVPGASSSSSSNWTSCERSPSMLGLFPTTSIFLTQSVAAG